ncbi:MAG TPA: acyltransferase family protein [Thermoanaerobaculia bacterium]|nr:acyltransferase family protein [Thermoanaerobaculia bacterium]
MPDASRNVPLGYLRTFLTLLVVAHHAVLAYHPYAPPPASSLGAEPRMWLAFPIVDSQRWPGFGLFVGFNDTFFMSLMFLISGLFAWPSLVRKGAAGFLRDRASRLGLPFLAAAGLLAPLAYYPTYLATGADPRPSSFLREWMRLGVWPAGPAWFLWLLLSFGGLAAAAFRLWPSWGTALGRLSGRLSSRPIAYFGALIAVSALAYLPMAAMFSPESWAHLGPCWVQTSRLLHYAVYFLAGAGLSACGVCGVDRGLLASDGKLARRWPLWGLSALAAFALAVIAVLVILQTLPKGGPGPVLGTLGNLTFVLSCACTSLACLAIFVRFARTAYRVADNLSANAYGIYLLHYFCVSWLQFWLLRTGLSGAVKGLSVFAGAVALSWSLSAALRRVPGIARVI